MSEKTKVTKCPPGRAAGSFFQSHAFDRKLSGNVSINADGDSTPDEATYAWKFAPGALSLKEIITSDEGED